MRAGGSRTRSAHVAGELVAGQNLCGAPAVQADLGGKAASYLVSKHSYSDFQIRAEFWVDSDANSGIFIRVTNPEKIGADSAYEVNIFDKRPDPAYGTGATSGSVRLEQEAAVGLLTFQGPNDDGIKPSYR